MAGTDETPASRPIDKVIEFINDMDDKLEAALVQYGDFIPDDFRPILKVVDEGLDKIVDFLTPFAENQPVRTFIEKIRERIAARRARKAGG